MKYKTLQYFKNDDKNGHVFLSEFPIVEKIRIVKANIRHMEKYVILVDMYKDGQKYTFVNTKEPHGDVILLDDYEKAIIERNRLFEVLKDRNHILMTEQHYE